MRSYEQANERYEIELRPQHVVVTRRFEHGVVVDETSSSHTTALRAKWEADKICTRLATRGFVRADGDDVASIGKAEFEDAIRANPDDRDTYLVYADWLSERGDDWGQLIAVQHALETLPRFGAAERRDELAREETMLRFRLSSRLWGALGERIHNEQTQTYECDLIDATWGAGFLRGAAIRAADDDVFPSLIAGLNELAIGIVLRELAIFDRHVDIEPIVARTWPWLERLVIDRDALDPAQIVPIFERAPRLVALHVWYTPIDLRGLTPAQKRDRVCEIAETR